jgi:hypothetical protein
MFGYTLAEAKKAVVSAVMFGAALVTIFVVYDPNITQALIVLVTSIFGVVAVFTKKNFTYDDASKAISQLQGAVFTALGFLTTIPAGTEAKVTVAVLALLSFFPVFFARNAPAAAVPVPGAVDDELRHPLPQNSIL